MKIAILGSKDYDSLEFHIHDSLKHLGHQIFHIDIKDVVKIPYRYNYWGRKLFIKYDEYVFGKIAKRIVDETPDLVICTYRFIHPKCIEFIKKQLKSTLVIHINPDQLTTLEHQQIFISPYDAYFTKDPFMINFMKNKMGLNTFYFPEAFNERVHNFDVKSKKDLEERINIDVVCFGTMYPYRARMVEKLIDAKINVKLFGTPDRRFPLNKINAKFQNEFITGSRKAEVLLGSKIVFNNFHYAEVQSVNAKFFEIAGIGAFQICDYKPTLEEYSIIPREKFTFNTIDESIELIKYYLNHQEERHTLADIQKKHFLQNHTYDIRMKQLFDLLGV
ncbi:glycosyltransferase [Chryseobacterium sp. P1-3]|uniref:Glycosyltransferase n=1 Tax=Chryseobacterium gallinarum TaxID=1324352 RepID=A0A0G3M113_CHRGL|nr:MULTISPECIES: glycosyltransferase [Chryseobacterium]AKK71678.1 glycosyltransferase [Chryseobacterium gallinarum]KFF75370.1 glycosyltransferase [Chryseobacterium sp. P1-3]